MSKGPSSHSPFHVYIIFLVQFSFLVHSFLQPFWLYSLLYIYIYIYIGRHASVFTHPFNKKSILFFYPFTWYQSHGGFEFRFVVFSVPTTHLVAEFLSDNPLLQQTFFDEPSFSQSDLPSLENLLYVALSSASDRIKYIFMTSLVHMTYMLQLEGEC